MSRTLKQLQDLQAMRRQGEEKSRQSEEKAAARRAVRTAPPLVSRPFDTDGPGAYTSLPSDR
jgi:hypothetical protein